MMELREYLFDNVYLSSDAKVEEAKAYTLVRRLFEHYMEQPDDMPDQAAPRADDPLPRLTGS